MSLRFFLLFLLFSLNLDAKVFFNQNDDILRHAGFYFDNSGRSQLCGPVSVINWLQLKLLRNQKVPLSKADFVKLLQAYQQRQNIDQGFTESELLEFIMKADPTLAQNVKSTAPNESAVFNSRASLLMIATYEVPNSHFHDPDYDPYRSFHWVLKTNGNAKESWIEFIDPEQPDAFTRMEVEVQKSGMNTIYKLNRMKPTDLRLQNSPGKKSRAQINWIIELE